MKKYFIWIAAVVTWNFLFPSVHPLWDVIMAIFLKHIFDIYKYMKIKLY